MARSIPTWVIAPGRPFPEDSGGNRPIHGTRNPVAGSISGYPHIGAGFRTTSNSAQNGVSQSCEHPSQKLESHNPLETIGLYGVFNAFQIRPKGCFYPSWGEGLHFPKLKPN